MGSLIYAFAAPLGIGTNNQAELQAAIIGITWCIQHGYSRVVLEVNFQLLVKWLKADSHPPWSIHKYIVELQELVLSLESFQCQHIYREANFTADALSKQSHLVADVQQYYSAQQLPEEAKGYFRLDKMGMSSFRRKKKRALKYRHRLLILSGLMQDKH